jgi:hypothetical protein
MTMLLRLAAVLNSAGTREVQSKNNNSAMLLKSHSQA